MGERQGAVAGLVSPPSVAPSLGEVLASYRGRRCFLTGHNGFVGSWLCHLLDAAGAEVVGYSLPPEPGALGAGLDALGNVRSLVGDVRDLPALTTALRESRAEIVVHLAAQALVLPSYDDPVATFATNVMGTAHLLEAVRQVGGVAACVVVTSDKCYATGPAAHVETDPLGGDDPYSASKAGAELVAQAYRASFAPAGGAIATTRAGNIVGGGDASAHRIVPDWARALEAGTPLELRHPEAVRPWQHVLDAVTGYVRLGAALLAEGTAVAEAWNFGPPASAAATVGRFVGLLGDECRARHIEVPEPVSGPPGPPERSVLTLDSEKAERRLAWRQVLDLASTSAWTVEWYAGRLEDGFDPVEATRAQIGRYLELEAAGAPTAAASSAPPAGGVRR